MEEGKKRGSKSWIKKIEREEKERGAVKRWDNEGKEGGRG